jgi:hypothetical protein
VVTKLTTLLPTKVALCDDDEVAKRAHSMPTLQQIIAKRFLEELAAKKTLDDGKIRSLRKLLEQSTKPKADDFVKILDADGGDVA